MSRLGGTATNLEVARLLAIETYRATRALETLVTEGQLYYYLPPRADGTHPKWYSIALTQWTDEQVDRAVARSQSFWTGVMS